MKDIATMSMAELAAFVCSHSRQQGIEVVLSGGGFVEIYSEGKYVSYDLDFIENLSSGQGLMKDTLAQIGFREEGRYFTHPDTEYFLEFPAGPLAVGDEPPQQVIVLKYETGDLFTLSVTDCIKDRLAVFFHWNDQQCLEQALLVAKNPEIDLAEIMRWSFKEGQKSKFEQFKALLEK